MSKKSTFKPPVNQTDWARVDAMKDEDIHYDDDSPRTRPKDWAEAVVHQGLPLPRKKTQIALRLDSDVLAWLILRTVENYAFSLALNIDSGVAQARNRTLLLTRFRALLSMSMVHRKFPNFQPFEV